MICVGCLGKEKKLAMMGLFLAMKGFLQRYQHNVFSRSLK